MEQPSLVCRCGILRLKFQYFTEELDRIRSISLLLVNLCALDIGFDGCRVQPGDLGKVSQGQIRFVHIQVNFGPIKISFRQLWIGFYSPGERIKRRLTGLRLACYYGCLSQRPPAVTGAKKYEHPDDMDRIVAALGAEPLSWSHKTECCSGSLTMARPDIARKLVSDIAEAARRAGADGMVTDCPMCQANVESRQLDLAGDDDLPVFFGTELISAALNGHYPAKQKKLHLVDASILDDVLNRAPQTREETV